MSHLKFESNQIVNKESLRPLLKWPGGKRWLAPIARSLMPRAYYRYIEPFAGGAALFFASAPRNAILSDINTDLIATYNQVKTNVEVLIARLNLLENSESSYYDIRETLPLFELDVAVRIVFLTRLSFNGIYRVNLDGQFNVPYGYKERFPVVDSSHMRACSRLLANAELQALDFRETLSMATKGDFIYIDPPYTTAHNNNGFIKYNERLFSWADQVDLSVLAEKAASRGASVMVSNADHRDIRELYKSFTCLPIERYTSVSGSSKGRCYVGECLFLSQPGRS